MSVLKIKDENNNWVNIPTIKSIYDDTEIREEIQEINSKVNGKLLVVSAQEPTGTNREKVWIRKSRNINNRGVAHSMTNGSGVINTNAANSYFGTNGLVKVKPNTTYSITFDDYVNGAFNLSEFDVNNTFIQRTSLGNIATVANRTFTTSSTTQYILPYIYSSSLEYDIDTTQIQIEMGSTPTPIEPGGESGIYILNDSDTYEKIEL